MRILVLYTGELGKKVRGKKRLTEDGYLVMELVDLIEQ
jgi:hypothetical protein